MFHSIKLLCKRLNISFIMHCKRLTFNYTVNNEAIMQCVNIKQYTIQQYRAIIYVIGNSSNSMIIHHFTVLIHRMSIPLTCDLATRYFRFQLIQIAISIYFQILTDATNSTFEMAVCRDGLTSTGPTRRGRNTRPDTRSMEGPRCVADTRRRP